MSEARRRQKLESSPGDVTERFSAVCDEIQRVGTSRRRSVGSVEVFVSGRRPRIRKFLEPVLPDQVFNNSYRSEFELNSRKHFGVEVAISRDMQQYDPSFWQLGINELASEDPRSGHPTLIWQTSVCTVPDGRMVVTRTFNLDQMYQAGISEEVPFLVNPIDDAGYGAFVAEAERLLHRSRSDGLIARGLRLLRRY